MIGTFLGLMARARRYLRCAAVLSVPPCLRVRYGSRESKHAAQLLVQKLEEEFAPSDPHSAPPAATACLPRDHL